MEGKLRNAIAQIFTILLLLQFTVEGSAQTRPDPVPDQTLDSQKLMEQLKKRPPLPDHEQQISRLLSQMTLQEKIGQMTQFDIAMITEGKDQEIKIDPAKLEKAIVQYGVGSVINVFDEALTPQHWQQFINAIEAASAKTRLKIPVMYGIDSIHGANYIQNTTLFPQPLGMAATWNPQIALRAAQITADETRAVGIPWTFSPVLDIGRQPLWPRLWETYGEDPHLASVIGTAMVRGYEGDNVADPHHVASSLKHYIGYSGPTSGRDRTPALIPENTLRQFYLPSFRAGVEAGARTVMVNSGEVNGVPGHTNHYLLTDVLKGELKFDGLVVSDWEDIKKLASIHHVAATEKEATRQAILAGIDMSMVPRDYSFPDLLTELAKEGAIPMDRIDDAVRRILRVKYQLGLFEHSTTEPGAVARIGTPQNLEVSLQAARESITLLQNKNSVLPFKQGTRLLVAGPTADTMVSMNNGWSYTWQGDKSDQFAAKYPTLRKALEKRAGAGNLKFVPGTTFDKELNIQEAVSAAASVDAIVLALGEASYTETPGNIADLTLSEPQVAIAKALIATGKPVVVVLLEGRPRIINSFAESAAGIVMAYNPGNMGGQAISEILFGDVNPSGRLPLTYPRNVNALMTYDHKAFEDEDQGFGLTAFKPQFEFGAGLSYTTFQYSDLKISPPNPTADSPITVSVKVSNTGSRAGKEVVEVFLRDVVATITPPGKRLVRFAKVDLQPGATQSLSFTLNNADLSFIGLDNKPKVEPGEFQVFVGGLKASFNLQ
ncbi:MAG TPA: glycoside hydrolase family 3 N-terminal domain-containing protein [Terriglobales bacterium]|nr:glycoside hydrolase family 3 N-terminal domain-containing protein [Terriglobales bacterium]